MRASGDPPPAPQRTPPLPPSPPPPPRHLLPQDLVVHLELVEALQLLGEAVVALPQLLDVVAGFGEDPAFALGGGERGEWGEWGAPDPPTSPSLTLPRVSYLPRFGVLHGAVGDDLGELHDPVVDLVPAPALHCEEEGGEKGGGGVSTIPRPPAGCPPHPSPNQHPPGWRWGSPSRTALSPALPGKGRSDAQGRILPCFPPPAPKQLCPPQRRQARTGKSILGSNQPNAQVSAALRSWFLKAKEGGSRLVLPPELGPLPGHRPLSGLGGGLPLPPRFELLITALPKKRLTLNRALRYVLSFPI